jgi:hypothetical protein
VKCGGIAGVGFVIARGDTAELLDLLEEVLDQVAPFVDLLVVGDDPGPAGIGGDPGVTGLWCGSTTPSAPTDRRHKQ